MNETISPPDLRFQIRQTATGTGDPDSMQNLNTVPLPNGAFVFVIATKTMYRLDKAAVSGGITPGSGPGQWMVFAIDESASGPAMVFSTNFNSFAVDGNWGQTTSANTGLDTVSDAAAWALTPLGCILTYSGPARKFNVVVAASVQVGDAAAPRDVFLGIGHNADLTGAPTAGTSGETDVVISTANASAMMVAERVISMATGDTIRPKMAGPAGATSLSAMLRINVTPA